MDIKEAARRLSKSEITIRRAIKDGKLKAKLQEGKYVITEEEINEYALSIQEMMLITQDDQELERLREGNETLKQEITQLRNQINEKEKVIEERQKRHDEMVLQLNSQIMDISNKTEDARQRSDTIILQLTRQLEQSQRLLEYEQEPWYRRMFRRKKTGEEETTGK